ncbi:MAG: virulence factor SrfB [Pseudomonadota bacterium]
MKKYPEYKSIVSLVPGGVPQFLDFQIDLNSIKKVQLNFLEKEVSNDSTGKKRRLSCLIDDDSGKLIDRTNKEVSDEFSYSKSGNKVIDLYLDTWIPLPFFRVKAEKWDVSGANSFCEGPSNWARCWVSKKADSDSLYDIVLCFDTALEDRTLENGPYFAIDSKDVDEGAEYALAYHERDNAWFLNSAWVDNWLQDEWNRQFKNKKRHYQDDNPFFLEHIAIYLTFLELLHRLDVFPKIKLCNHQKNAPIDVDLVIDLGNSRTTGILIETIHQKNTNLNDSYLLQLRDLTQPANVYTEPFPTRIEFSEANFGNPTLSQRSGRLGTAFKWPSAVRVGTEAVQLSARAEEAEGSTGMSSPKRYLWDEKPRIQGWRCNGYSPDGYKEPPATRGAFAEKVNDEGTPLARLKERYVLSHPVLKKQGKTPAFDSLYTRSSLTMFMLSEVIMHALVTINSPGQRVDRDHPDLPRRLKSIIMTVPTAMPIAEQNILKRWSRWAVGLVWDIMEWKIAPQKPNLTTDGEIPYQFAPTVRCDWDEATCTQLVYVYNEAAVKFQGDVHHFFNTMGKKRSSSQFASLRVACIDIGAGTTDLSITTMTPYDDSYAARIMPKQEFRDGFNLAGDDVLRAVIEDHFFRDLRNAMSQAGVPDPRLTVSQLFGDHKTGESQSQKMLRGRFTRLIAVPVALWYIGLYERHDPKDGVKSYRRRLGDILDDLHNIPDAVVGYVNNAAHRGANSGFSLMDVELFCNTDAIDSTIRTILQKAITSLGEVVNAYDCDALLLTGRPSMWPSIKGILLSELPLPVDRIIPMHEYRVGSWYPFSDHLGYIRDPKTTVVAGAILCALTEHSLAEFSFDASSFKLISTARFIGIMDNNGQIKNEQVKFRVDPNSSEEIEKETSAFSFDKRISIGFRQVDVERWPATPLYLIDFKDQLAVDESRNKLPYKITLLLLRDEVDEDRPPDSENDNRDEGGITIEEISVDAEGPYKGDGVHESKIVVQLQTLSSADGYWLDTGEFKVL